MYFRATGQTEKKCIGNSRMRATKSKCNLLYRNLKVIAFIQALYHVSFFLILVINPTALKSQKRIFINSITYKEQLYWRMLNEMCWN